MGHFTVAVDTVFGDAGIHTKKVLVEANPALAQPIRENLDFYGIREYELVSAGLAPASSSTAVLCVSPEHQIGATIKERATRDEGAMEIGINTVSLDSLVMTTDTCIIKLDLEGTEQLIFSDLLDENLNNYFIVEFSPDQIEENCRSGSYGRFLLDSYAIYNLGDWLRPLSQQSTRCINSIDELGSVSTEGRGSNVDLLLVPRYIAGAEQFFQV
jgi:hypothetical protein